MTIINISLTRFRQNLTRLITGLTAIALPVIMLSATPVGATNGISYRSASSSVNAVATALTLSEPTGVTGGDVLLATVDIIQSPTVTAPTGWTLVRSDSNTVGTHLKQAIYTHVATASEPASYTWKFSVAEGASGSILDYSGVDTAKPVDVTSGQQFVNATTLTAPSLTAASANETLVANFGISDAQSLGAPTGMSQRALASANNVPGQRATTDVSDQLLSNAGATGTRSLTTGSGVSGLAQLVALRPDTTAPTAPANLIQTSITTNSVGLSWNTSNDNAAVAGYTVYQTGNTVTTTTSTNYVLSGLQCGQSYSLAVDAYDAAGNHSGQTALTASTASCPDTTPPVASITSPVDGSSVQGPVTLSANATDNVAVASVQFRIDGTPVGPLLTNAPYTFSWDSTTVADGSHTVDAVATDTGGNTTNTSPINIITANNGRQSQVVVVDSVTISPSSPVTNSVLTATVAAHNSPTGPLDYSYQWLDNGVPITGAISPSIDTSVPGNGDKGDQISVVVIANTNGTNSTPFTASPVTIADTPPVASVNLSSATPDTDATLTATATASDADGDPVSLTYVWQVNGVTKQTMTTTALSSRFDLSQLGNGNYGDTISVSITPNDGQLNGTIVSAQATVTKPATGTVVEYTLPTTALPSAITQAPDGNIWFGLEQSNLMGKLSPSGNFQMYTLPATGNQGGINPGPDGNIWFTEFSSSKVANINPATGKITEYPLSGSPGVGGIAAGSDGNMWFLESSANKIGRITMTGTVSLFTIPTAGGFPHGLNLGPDGNMWFTELNSGKIGRITPAGAITEFSIPSGVASKPFVIVAGPDGNMWFTEGGNGQIGSITLAGKVTEFPLTNSSAGPGGITSGPDGNLWFTERNTGKVGRITTSGVTSEYPLSSSTSQPDKIITGLDGNLWLTEHNADKIGRITP